MFMETLGLAPTEQLSHKQPQKKLRTFLDQRNMQAAIWTTPLPSLWDQSYDWSARLSFNSSSSMEICINCFAITDICISIFLASKLIEQTNNFKHKNLMEILCGPFHYIPAPCLTEDVVCFGLMSSFSPPQFSLDFIFPKNIWRLF